MNARLRAHFFVACGRSALFYLFLFFYVYYIVMSLVVLLNLLIAMMSDTYANALEHATRQFRVNFARRVLRLELQLLWMQKCGWITLNCGEKVGAGADAMWVHNYRNYLPNAEGGGTRGAKPSMFADDVEREADEDMEDDDGPGAGDADEVSHANRMAMTIQRQPTLALPGAAHATGRPSGPGQPGSEKMRKVGKAVVFVTPIVPPQPPAPLAAPHEAPMAMATAIGLEVASSPRPNRVDVADVADLEEVEAA